VDLSVTRTTLESAPVSVKLQELVVRTAASSFESILSDLVASCALLLSSESAHIA